MSAKTKVRLASAALVGALVVAACSSGGDSSAGLESGDDQAAVAPAETPSPEVPAAAEASARATETPTPDAPAASDGDGAVAAAEPTPTAAPAPAVPTGPAAPNGEAAPHPPRDAAALAELLIGAERAIRDPATTAVELDRQAHLQQVIYRMWANQDAWDATILAAMPADLLPAVEANLAARREFTTMVTGYGISTNVPAWEIVEPEPAEALLGFYREAEQQSGIGWEYLAAINLVETGMGRIRGLSAAGAQGPMQFMPATWDAVGEGDVNDPRDAILAAARYLVDRGGPADMEAALWGYNNSDNYVRAVSHYADVMRQEPATFAGYHEWEIYFFTETGDLWLPEGYLQPEAIPAEDYLAVAPWSAPRPGG